MKRELLSSIMKLAWQFVKQTGLELSECLKRAWKFFKLKKEMRTKIVRFYYQKVDGSIREAWGSLKPINPNIATPKRKRNDTVQVYFDTEKQEWRSFKKFNLVSF